MSNIGSHDPFEYLQYKLWSKEGPRIKMSIWLLIIKNQESPWITCVKMTFHISLKSSQRGLQLCFKPHLNCRLHKKLWASKVARVPILRISRLLREKWHYDVTPMAIHKEYYKGEGDVFPQVRVMVSIVSSCIAMIRLCTKNAPTMH